MLQRFSVNVKNGVEQYLRLNYSTEENSNSISDRGGLEIDVEVIKDAVSRS